MLHLSPHSTVSNELSGPNQTINILRYEFRVFLSLSLKIKSHSDLKFQNKREVENTGKRPKIKAANRPRSLQGESSVPASVLLRASDVSCDLITARETAHFICHSENFIDKQTMLIDMSARREEGTMGPRRMIFPNPSLPSKETLNSGLIIGVSVALRMSYQSTISY